MKTFFCKQNNNRLELKFQYNPEKIAAVKTIYGYRWHSTEKMWSIPHTNENIEKLKKIFPEFTSINLDTNPATNENENKNENKNENENINIMDIKIPLYPFQKQGVKFILGKKRCLLADEMGLGKTVQTITAIITEKKYPALIVCPAGLKYNWKNEFAKFAPEIRVDVVNGSASAQSYDVQIISYDNIEKIQNNLYKLIVADECHYIKNRKTKRTQIFRELCKKNPDAKIIFLSGTPVINRSSEFFNTLNIIDPTTFSSFWKFAERYCDLTKTRYGWDYSGASNTEELSSLLKNIMLRRLKNDVLDELPEKIRTIIPIDIGEKYTAEYYKRIIDKPPMNVLAEIEKLKQSASAAKIPIILEWIENFLETGEKIVLFAVHREILDALELKFKNICVRVDGETPPQKRQEFVNQFNNDSNVKIFLGNIKAAGVGLTLTAANALAFLELGWTPGEHIQAEDRIHRIGQKNACNIFYFVAKDTIEEKIMKILQQKMEVLTAILDGKMISENDKIYDLLIEQLKNETKGENENGNGNKNGNELSF